MKKIIGFLSLAVILAATSCTDSTTKAETETTEKEIIYLPAEETKTEVIVVEESNEPVNSTKVSVDGKGIKFETQAK